MNFFLENPLAKVPSWYTLSTRINLYKKIWTYTFLNSCTLFDAFYVKCTLEMEKKYITPGGNDDETYLHFNKKSYHIETKGEKLKSEKNITISVDFFFFLRRESNTTMFAQETYYSFEYKWSLMSLNFYENIRRKAQ